MTSRIWNLVFSKEMNTELLPLRVAMIKMSQQGCSPAAKDELKWRKSTGRSFKAT